MAGAAVVSGFKVRLGAAEDVTVELPKLNGATEAVVVVEARPKPNPVLAGCVAVAVGAENPNVAVVVVDAGAPKENPVADWEAVAAAGCAATDNG